MISSALLLLASTASAAGFSRLELLSEGSGRFLRDELPLVGARPGVVGVQALAQVEPVWGFFDDKLTLGASLSAQSIQWERPLPLPGMRLMVGAHARLLLPVGVQASVGWRGGSWTIGAGAALSAAAGWDRPRWDGWGLRPTVLVAWSPRRPAPAAELDKPSTVVEPSP